MKTHGKKSVHLIAESVWNKCKPKQCPNISFRTFCAPAHIFPPETYYRLRTLSIKAQSQFYIVRNQSTVSLKVSCAAAHILAVKPHGRKSVNLITKSVWHKRKPKQCLNVSFRISCTPSNAFYPKTYKGRKLCQP